MRLSAWLHPRPLSLWEIREHLGGGLGEGEESIKKDRTGEEREGGREGTYPPSCLHSNII